MGPVMEAESQPLDGQESPQVLLITSMDTSLGPKALDEGILIFLPDFFFEHLKI